MERLPEESGVNRTPLSHTLQLVLFQQVNEMLPYVEGKEKSRHSVTVIFITFLGRQILLVQLC